MQWTDDPAALGLNRDRFERMLARAAAWCEAGELPALSLVVGRSERVLTPWSAGRIAPDRPDPVDSGTIFTITSITKPLVTTMALRLLEEGVFAVGDRVCNFLPEFRGAPRQNIRVRHLLTHTSGLPDLLPEDRELRARNAPLGEFLEYASVCELQTPPGRAAAYSSCGFLLLGELLSRLAGRPLPQLIREELFEPLGMRRSVLGAPHEWFDPETEIQIAEVRLPADQIEGPDWNWNSRYWRTLGAPWGGVLAPIDDLARFAQMMLTGGMHEDRRLLSQAGIEAATGNALAMMTGIAETERRTRPWGLGWRLQWSDHAASFGDLASRETYGHWGASGTLLWIDPCRDLFAIFLSTEPIGPGKSHLTRLSNMLLAAAS